MERKFCPDWINYICLIVFLMTILACQNRNQNQNKTIPLFEFMNPEYTSINFVNSVEEKPGNNILESEFFYNGAGVSVGDINNDGLSDLYFTANQGKNALYLNNGDFQFQDITSSAGVEDSDGWTAGTSMVDINADGFLDMYVCKAGDVSSENRRNKLFINNGDLTFTEQAAKYGLDDAGFCTQAVFFDYDLDGDLDTYIVNYSTKRSFTGFDLNTIRREYEHGAADRLFRNDNDRFTDVSSEAGLIQNPLGFGLSATVSDVNKDGLPDIYVANDFIERDYLYVNQGDGTFSEDVLRRTQLTSYFSMGSDIADINNDALSDILVVDMLPYEYSRRRVFKGPEYSHYQQLSPVYHRKNMRNVLQLNNGNGTFSEIGQLAGISATDWSWAPLIADFDNDGWKDIFITNGFPRFYTDLDYLNNVLWKKYPNENYPDDPELRYDLVEGMQKVDLHNFAFKNDGNLSFSDVSEEWGVNQNAVSTGAAYADLNNDGSLDLIVSNINESALIFKNSSAVENGNNYLKIKLAGSGGNTFGLGAKVTLTNREGETYYQENYPVRGYQSSVDPILHFGLGKSEVVDVEVVWPNQTKERLDFISVNQTLTLEEEDASAIEPNSKETESNSESIFALLNQTALGLNFTHSPTQYQDKQNVPLMPYTLNNLGPAITKGDVNGDGLQDVFLGGSVGQASVIYIQLSNGRFSPLTIPDFEQDRHFNDVDAEIFDVNGDEYLDLYVVSGGNHAMRNGSMYQDRLYMNDGNGNFRRNLEALPEIHASGGTVTIIEINDDGQPDLFIGGRVITNRYPFSPRSYILENDGGIFKDVTEEVSPELLHPGMVTDGAWADINGDGSNELVIVGEYMPVRILEKNEAGKFEEITEEAGLDQSNGLWNVLKVNDLNSDGHLDLVAGNWGLNSSFKATPEEPMIVYAGDFNRDGFVDPILTKVIDGKRYPLAGRDKLISQIPPFEERFPDYKSYSTSTISDILNNDELKDSQQLEIHTLESTVFKNNGDGTFQPLPFPVAAQSAPIHDILVSDFNEDGIMDIIAGGNNYGTSNEEGPIAGQGFFLKGQIGQEFRYRTLGANDTGLIGVGDIRNIELVESQIGQLIVLGRYGDSILIFHNKKHQNIN